MTITSKLTPIQSILPIRIPHTKISLDKKEIWELILYHLSTWKLEVSNKSFTRTKVINSNDAGMPKQDGQNTIRINQPLTTTFAVKF